MHNYILIAIYIDIDILYILNVFIKKKFFLIFFFFFFFFILIGYVNYDRYYKSWSL